VRGDLIGFGFFLTVARGRFSPAFAGRRLRVAWPSLARGSVVAKAGVPALSTLAFYKKTKKGDRLDLNFCVPVARQRELIAA
jgi:hypothetical protein